MNLSLGVLIGSVGSCWIGSDRLEGIPKPQVKTLVYARLGGIEAAVLGLSHLPLHPDLV